MKEAVLEFGAGRRLVGVLCRPAQKAIAPVAVVITNSGIIHRAGANRLHVRLARSLAAQGYACLRYDLPGIGDSEATAGDPAAEEITATRAALDAMQKLGLGSAFVMVGLCSGATHSFEAAATDPRIVGAMLIDPPAMFATRRHRFNRLLDAAKRVRPHKLWRLATGRYQVTRMVRERSIEPQRYGMPESLNAADHAAERQHVAEVLRTLGEREVQLNLVITGHNRTIYSYDRQLEDAFPDVPGLGGRLRVEQRPGAAHTFTREIDRAFLERALLEWLRTAPFVVDPPEQSSARRAVAQA